MGILANENSISAGGYTIERSLRFQSASSQSANRTFTTPTNNKIWTWSAWVKRGSNIGSGNQQHLFDSWLSGTSQTGFIFSATTDTMELYDYTGTYGFQLVTTQVFRDPSAWYHIVIAADTTQATASNRLKLYINGTQVTAFGTSTYPSLNYNTLLNSARSHVLGQRGDSNGFFDGYMTEINFIDGQALTPSSFGETDALTGVWVAKRYTGTYGTNGFYLKFNDGTSTTTLGQDRSGNANNWTLTNFTRSAGVSDCWMYDVPSGNGSPSATQPSSNYCVLNPLKGNGAPSSTRANLQFTSTNANWSCTVGTIAVNSGKWYFECIPQNAGEMMVGILLSDTALNTTSTVSWVGYFSGGYAYWNNGYKFNNNTNSAYGASYTANDVLGVALDLDAGTLTFYKNNVSQGTAFSGLSGNFNPAVSVTTIGGTNAVAVNFGQRSFAYTPPSGFKALCTANLPAPTIAKGNQYMDATLWSGNSTARSITNAAGFSPDLVWIKNRSSTDWHIINDAVRGVPKNLYSNTTNAEDTGSYVTALNSDGFSLSTSAGVNGTGSSYVGWQWDAGSSTVTNTSGTISSQVRANTTAGFSIVTFTKGGTSTTKTVGHGLGVAPAMIIAKARNAVDNWPVYHISNGATFYQELNTTIAKTSGNPWGNTTPTSTVFSVQDNGTANWVAYCFAEIAGFSRFGSYTGNGSTDGPFVYCGFRPKYVLIKATAGIESWMLHDTSRSPSNLATERLYPNLSNAEDVGTYGIDILSNGFKVRNSLSSWNANGVSYIFMAFAENPFNFSNAR